jgi:hypothetical protein
MFTPYVYDDGGRAAAGYEGTAGDCVVRSIAIATGLPYEDVYRRCAAGNAMNGGKRSARNGVRTKDKWFKEYMAQLGFEWVATMHIGSGTKIHLTQHELPGGRIICKVSGHYVAVIDGVIHDTYDPSRYGTRAVYGYWQLAREPAALTRIDTTKARLPVSYEQAKVALASCERIDECRDWANKAEALATYAKMADDDTLRQTADRIRARAVRRMGELLKQIDGSTRNKDISAPIGKEGALLTQKEVAENAGISEHQRKQAVRVANVPAEQFEQVVEAEKAATVTTLAGMGKQKRVVASIPPVEVKPPVVTTPVVVAELADVIRKAYNLFEVIEAQGQEAQLLEMLASDSDLRDAVYDVADGLMYQLEQLSGRVDHRRRGLKAAKTEIDKQDQANAGVA